MMYLLFGVAHDPGIGGADHFIAAYESLEEAKKEGIKLVQKSIDDDDTRYATSDVYRWMHIAGFDGITMKIVTTLVIRYWRGGPKNKEDNLSWEEGRG